MSISVITVALNAAADLPLTIESVAQQDFPSIQYVVVDGGSWDHTPSVLNRYDDVIDRVVRIEDAGIYYAMNQALDYCDNEFVLFLNAKDRLYSHDTISRIWSLRDPTADIFYGNHIWINGPEQLFKRSSDFGILMEALRRGPTDRQWLDRIPCHQATFTRRSLLSKLKYDTRFEICADHEFLLRAYEEDAKLQYIDQIVCHYIGGGLSAQRTGRLLLEWSAAYRERSERPEVVDRLFLPETSPFSAQNRLTGLWIDGAEDAEEVRTQDDLPIAIRWCSGEGFRLRSPLDVVSDYLTISGYNPFPGQAVTLMSDGAKVGRGSISQGWFSSTIHLPRSLARNAVVDVVPNRLGAVSRERPCVCFAVSRFQFGGLQGSGLPTLYPGETLLFSSATSERTRQMLREGWSLQEALHIWSIGDEASLAIRARAEASAIELTLRGNPYLDPTDRSVELLVNEQLVKEVSLEVEDTTVELKCDDPPWSRGKVNVVRMRPRKTMAPPSDPRVLGVCLVALRCR